MNPMYTSFSPNNHQPWPILPYEKKNKTKEKESNKGRGDEEGLFEKMAFDGPE